LVLHQAVKTIFSEILLSGMQHKDSNVSTVYSSHDKIWEIWSAVE